MNKFDYITNIKFKIIIYKFLAMLYSSKKKKNCVIMCIIRLNLFF